MTRLIVQKNQISYVGIFSKPIFSLYGKGEIILAGLYDILTPYQITIADIRSETSSSLSDQSIVVSLGIGSTFKFSLDRIELTLYDYHEQQFWDFPDILKRSEEWLRSSIADFSFQTHLFTYASQNALSEESSQEFLLRFSNVDIPGVGISEGTGMIFHWNVPEKGWRSQLTLDHSLAVLNGLFLQYLIRMETDKINYKEIVTAGKSTLDLALAQIGLETSEG